MSNPESVPPSLSLDALALFILGQVCPDSAGRKSGSILASERKAWRYENDGLIDVPWQEYERALGSTVRSDWPPYAIAFSVSPGENEQTIRVRLTIDYATGICEESRGGEEVVWALGPVGGSWQLLSVEQVMSWD